MRLRGSAASDVGLALVDDPAALVPRSRPEVDHVVGGGDDRGVVLHHHHGVPLVAQGLEDPDQPVRVPRVQAHGRLVEDEQGADEARPESGGQGDPLRLAAGKRGRRAVEAQVVEAHLLEEGQPPVDLAEHAARHLFLRRREDEPGQEPPSGTDRQLAEVPDREAPQAHLQGLGAQPAPAAGGAGLVAAVPGQEGPHLDAVLAPLEPAEEPQDAGELVVSLEDEPPVAFLEKGPGHVERDAPPAGEPPQLGQDPAVVGLVPGLDRPLPEAAVLVGHHEVEVDLDQVPEAVAGGAGPERVVEREQARLRLEERPAALRALEVLRDPKRPAAPARRPPPARRPRARRPPASRRAGSSPPRSAAPGRRARAPRRAPRRPRRPRPSPPRARPRAAGRNPACAGRPAPPREAAPGGAKATRARAPADSASRRSAAAVADSRRTGRPQPSQAVRPARANSSRRWSWISVAVATVDRGLRESVRCRMAIAGQIPCTSSTRGFSIRSRNWRA